MKELLDWKRFRFYFWAGMVYLAMWLVSDRIQNPETFDERLMNNIWRAMYVIVLNYILFEYTNSFFSAKKYGKFFLLLFAQFFLYSYGLYLWRALGIGLHIYTALVSFKTFSI